jgi:6-pyruvoyltetrahydropterin/6-carboxytetrahydropterin synthase
MIYITRREHFSASHILKNPALPNEKNEDIFGKCNQFHGHNYYLEVTLCGIPDETSGYVMDLKELKIILNDEIISKVDHKFLNDTEMFKDKIPTTENMALIFWNVLKEKINRKNVRLYSIRIFETEKNIIEYRGE